MSRLHALRRATLLAFATAALPLLGIGCVPVPTDAAVHPDVVGRLQLSPASASAGVPRVLWVRADASYFDEATRPEVSLGDGVVVSTVEVQAADLLRVQVLVDDDAVLGPRDLRVSWPGGWAVRRGAFAVESGSLAFGPSRGTLGEALRVEVSGWRTDFQDGITQLSLGEGVEIDDIVVLSATRLYATVFVEPRATPGRRDLWVYNPGGASWSLSDAFVVDRTARTMVVDPPQADQGQILKFAVDAEGGEFTTGATSLDLGTGVVVLESYVRDDRRLHTRIRIGNNARIGPRDVVVRTASPGGPEEVRILRDGFTIHPVEAEPEDVRISLGFSISRSWNHDLCRFRPTVNASALFYVPNDFPCPPSGGSSSLVPPPRFDNIGTGYTIQGGATDCPAPKTFDAGPSVQFVREGQHVDLLRDHNPYSGRVVYRGWGLAEADYVPAQSYALHTDGGDLGWNELPPMDIPVAIRTLPRDFDLHTPDFCGFQHPIDAPLTVEWDAAATYDDALMALYLSGFPDATLGTPTLMAYPWDDGAFTYSQDDLAFLPDGYAALLQLAYRTTRFDVPGAIVANAGNGNSSIVHRAEFELLGPGELVE